MEGNIYGLVLVLVFGVQGLMSGNALAYNPPDKVSLKAEIVEGTALPDNAMDD